MKKPNLDFPKQVSTLNQNTLKKIVEYAAIEDLDGVGDITTLSIMNSELREIISAEIITKQDGVICGVDVVREVYKMICGSDDMKITGLVQDGDEVKAGDTVIKIQGTAQGLLSGERSALNFLGLMSGIATKVRHYTTLLEGSKTRILDTRKTIPGLREIQKYAVHCGGGSNHRVGLFDMILLKENHLKVAGGVVNAVLKAHELYPNTVIEVEVETLEQVKEALLTEADILMLDNMDNERVKKALSIINNEKYVEVSGNITSERIKSLSQLGVDFISIGELTHTVKPLDLSLLIR